MLALKRIWFYGFTLFFQDFLKKFSRYNFDGFCLGVLFTNRAFSELVLGLSWRGNPDVEGVGGVCQNRVRIKSDGNAYSFNALFISLKSSQEQRIPLRMGVLNLVHELMHSFGAKHDPEANEEPECTPHDRVAVYFLLDVPISFGWKALSGILKATRN